MRGFLLDNICLVAKLFDSRVDVVYFRLTTRIRTTRRSSFMLFRNFLPFARWYRHNELSRSYFTRSGVLCVVRWRAIKSSFPSWRATHTESTTIYFATWLLSDKFTNLPRYAWILQCAFHSAVPRYVWRVHDLLRDDHRPDAIHAWSLARSYYSRSFLAQEILVLLNQIDKPLARARLYVDNN